MELTWPKEDQEFREEVRTWLAENKPKETRPEDPADAKEYDKAWQRTQYDGGWAGINWPKEYGGKGLGIWQQMIWQDEFFRAGCTQGCMDVALNHGGLTIATRANDALKEEHVPKIMRGEKVWAQGFSEPSAGSDVAGIKTRGVIDGDEVVVTGQKIWTSYAHFADWQILLVRTDPEAERHRGLTMLLNPMNNKGMEVRRIPTMNAHADFCEVFYDEVRIPLSNVVGEINDGWNVAMGTLGVEHGTLAIRGVYGLMDRVERLIDLARETVGPDGRRMAIQHDDIALRLAQYRAQIHAMRAMVLHDLSRAVRELPTAKLYNMMTGILMQEMARLSVEILGTRKLSGVGDAGQAEWIEPYLGSYAATIGGGTSEVKRNNIGRMLGLPR